MNTILFYLLSLVIAVSAFMVVTLKNIFHSALFLVLTLFGVAGIYLTLGAEFIAGVQVLIYVGAITILLIFAIMLTQQLMGKHIRQVNEQVLPASIVVGIFFILSLLALLGTTWPRSDQRLPSDTIAAIGKVILTDYVIPFEVVSVVLLAALIGAVVISRTERYSRNDS